MARENSPKSDRDEVLTGRELGRRSRKHQRESAGTGDADRVQRDSNREVERRAQDVVGNRRAVERVRPLCRVLSEAFVRTVVIGPLMGGPSASSVSCSLIQHERAGSCSYVLNV
ncbi:unnamed protein product [Ascophyllum nodosum]